MVSRGMSIFALLAALALLSVGGCAAEDAAGDGASCGCDGAVCGVNSCGASCGTCAEGAEFCAAGACVAAEGCDLIGFAPTAEAAFTKLSGGSQRLYYLATTGGEAPPFDKLQIELSHERFFADGAPRTGTFPLAGIDNDDCDLCVRGFSYCNDTDCFNKFVPVEGEITITGSGEPGTPFEATLSGVRLQEVRIVGGTTVPHAPGKSWCMGDTRVKIDVPETPKAESTCVAAGTGTDLGNNVADYTLTNCLGWDVNLHSRCGAFDAVWIVATAGWCGACEAFVPQAADKYRELADQGLDLMVVIGEDGSRNAPTLEYCKAYAADKGLDPEWTFIDHNGTTSWPETFGAINTYTSSVGLPWNAVLDGRSMEYVWSSNAGTGEMYEVIEGLLAR